MLPYHQQSAQRTQARSVKACSSMPGPSFNLSGSFFCEIKAAFIDLDLLKDVSFMLFLPISLSHGPLAAWTL